MAPTLPADHMNPQIYQEASDWLVRNRENELDESAKRAFDLWLRASPEHIRAYLELSALWEDLAQLDAGSLAAQLIARVRAEENVVRLDDERTSTALQCRAPTAHPTSRAFRRPAVLVASVAMLCFAVAFAAWIGRDLRYSTGVGEQRSIILADGSTVELNSRSRIRIHFSKRERFVELLEGQALFRVTKDRNRPFIVRSDRARVRAVGTQFDVDRRRAGTVVTVLEGQVAVAPGGPDLGPSGARARSSANPHNGAGRTVSPRHESESILLSAGEQLTVASQQVSEPLQADIEAVTAWTQRRFVFNDSPLTQVADMFNRFNMRRLIIADGDVESVRISGVFSSSDPDLLLRFLRAQPDLEVQETDDAIVISRK